MKNFEPILSNNITTELPLIIAGPCSAESESQVLQIAGELNANGINVFRAGIWKPRTKPGGFEGVGSKGLDWLRKVKQQYGMYVSTEVANKNHVIEAVSSGVDILWIGARTCANPFAMQEIADTLEMLSIDIPVLIKNPVNPDLELWIGGIQRIYNAGIRRIGAIHRGFSVYGKHIYRNQPQWHLPIELHRRFPDLSIIHDPSHVGGKREFVSTLSQQALDLGFDGLMIETHDNPDCALSDKDQQITPKALFEILSKLVYRKKDQTNEILNQLRQQIDEYDYELIELLAKRMSVCREIGEYKKEKAISIVQNKRYDEIMSSRVLRANQLGLSSEFIVKVLESVHTESIRQQIDVFRKE
ncbi:MAG: 3-deoxy-7-phosphoheptulonate synthase [Bacteroidales bacterium]|nr:3-deoxy-7-phosphoheptulonate synthase [Bacteroidales bacterium]